MKSLKFSTLLRVLALALSLLVMLGAMPVTAFGEEPTETEPTTAVEDGQEPVDTGDEDVAPTEEDSAAGEEATEEPTEPATKKDVAATGTVEDIVFNVKEKGSSVFDDYHNGGQLSTAGLNTVEVVMMRYSTEMMEDRAKMSVVFLPADEYTSSSIVTDNMIMNWDADENYPWVTPSPSSASALEWKCTLKFAAQNAPYFADGDYILAARDGEENIATMQIKLISNGPELSFGSVSDNWSNSNVTVDVYTGSDYVESVTYTDGTNTYNATHVSGQTWQATFTDYAKANKYTFTATDEAGSTDTAVLGSEIKIDKAKPTVTINSYSDGEEELDPASVYLAKDRKVYAIVTAQDVGKSGLKENPIAVNGTPVTAVKRGSSFLVPLSEPGKVNEITAEDKTGNVSVVNDESKTAAFKYDYTPASAEDVQVIFTTIDNNAQRFWNSVVYGLYTNKNVNMTVKVYNHEASNDDNVVIDGSAVKTIVAKNDSDEMDGGAVEHDDHGYYWRTFTLPAEVVNDAISFTITDEATNSAEIALTDIKKVYTDDETIVEHNPVYEVVSTNQAPSVTAFSVSGGPAAVNGYYKTAQGDQTVTLTVSEPLSGLRTVPSIFFAPSSALIDEGGEYDPDIQYLVTDVSVNPTITDDTKCTAQTLTFTLPADLETGEYTVLVQAVNNSGDGRTNIPNTIKVDNNGPVISKTSVNPDSWTNQKIKVRFTVADNGAGFIKDAIKVTKKKGESTSNVSFSSKGNGTFEFETEENAEFTVTATDRLNNATAEPLKVKVDHYDHTDPEIVITGYDPNPDPAWSAEKVKVSFMVSDNSGALNKPTVDGLDDDQVVADPEVENGYYFYAEENRVFEITVEDAATNSKTVKTKSILFDDQKPVIKKVIFAVADDNFNFKKFGIYDNKAITATVYVESPGHAPVNKIELLNNNEVVPHDGAVTAVEGETDLYSRTFVLAKSNTAYKLSFEAENKAGKKDKANIADLDLYFNSEEDARTIEEGYKGEFKLVATESKPTIDFGEGLIDNYKSCANAGTSGLPTVFAPTGSGTISASVTDYLSGIKAIKSVKFGIVDSLADVTDDADFTVEQDHEDPEVTINYTFTDQLESGVYQMTIEAENNAGNKETKSQAFYLDTTPPEATSRVDMEEGTFSNEPIPVIVTVDDDADEFGYYSGVKSVTVKDDAAEITGNGDGTWTVTATARQDYTVLMEDNLGNKSEYTIKANTIPFDNSAPILVDNQFFYNGKADPSEMEWANLSNGIWVTFELNDDLSGVDVDSIAITGDTYGGDYTAPAHGFEWTYTEAGTVSCKFKADCYQTYTVTVSDSVINETKNTCGGFTTADLNVDITDPVIESVTIESAATVGDKILNILTFGLYHNNDLKMTVNVKDEAASAGISEINYSCNDSEPYSIIGEDFTPTDPSGSNDVTASRVFTISLDDRSIDPAQILLWTVDDVGNATSDTVSLLDLYQSNKVIIDGNDGALTAPFEIVASSKKPDIAPITLDGDGRSESGDEIWYRGDEGNTEVTVSTQITADLTKLHEIKVEFNGVDITDQVTITDNDTQNVISGGVTDYTAHSGNSVKDVTVTFPTGTIANTKRASGGDAANTVTITAVGNNGEPSTAVKTFYIDDTDPEITSVSFTSAATAGDKILNILTFGIYHNDNIKMTVAVKDGKPSSGIKDIYLVDNDDRITPDAFTATSDSLDSDATPERVFTFNINNAKFDSTAIKLNVTDNTGNSPEEVSLNDLNTANKLSYSGDKTLESNFEIVATTQPPTVSDIKLSVSDSRTKPYTDANNKVWYQGDQVDEIAMSFTACDPLSKLHSVQAYLNDSSDALIIDDVYTSFNTADANDVQRGADAENPELYSLNTAQYGLENGLNRLSENANGNRFYVTVVNNSGNDKKKQSSLFYIDDVKPAITAFAFSGDGYSDVYSDDENGGLNPENVEVKDYGFYFKQKTTVTVTASDYAAKARAQGSGVKGIGFRFVDINGTEYDYGVRAVENNQAKFEVNAEFKGRIYAYAVDNVNNISDTMSPARLIVESAGAHELNSGSSITYGETNHHGKDNNNIDLYSGDVTVSFTVSDSISGLRDACYTVTNGSEVVEFRKVNVSNNGTIDNGMWSIDKRESDSNLITQLSLTDTISAQRFNANNLVVTVTAHDRCGYTIESKKSLSIDITKPKIEVTFDPADPVNVDSGNNYYSTTRTATITVTERNFNPADFDWSKMTAIEGTVPGYAAGANWNRSYTDYTDSSTHTATVTFADDGKYEVILNFTDMAGNKADQVDAGQFYVDKTVPTISVSLSPDREYTSGTVTATVTIVEHNFNPDAKYLQLTPHYFAPDQTTTKSGPSLAAWSTSGDTHTATLTFSEDGKYSFDIAFMDMALNKATPYTGKVFYVDQTKPKITFGTQAENGHAYDQQVQPSFDVFDYNYAGVESVKYTLTRNYYDFASGKQVSSEVGNSGVTVSYVEGVIKQLFTYPLMAQTEDNDGVYTLTVSATDKAGNVSDPSSITFSINCFGSVFLLASDETIDLANSGYTSNAPDIVIKEINVNELKDQSMTLSYNNSNKPLTRNSDYTINPSGGGNNWYEYLYTIPASHFAKEGNYTVTASSTDVKLGTVTTNRTVNAAEGENAVHKNCPVSFVVDKTAPSVTISGVEENGAYSEAEREIQITCLDDNLDKSSVVLKINGEPVELTPDQIDDSLVGELDINYTILASGQQTDYKVEVEVKDYAGVKGTGAVNKFTLSATWLTMFFHNTPAVIATAVVLAALIALAIFLAIKKSRKKVA